MATHTDRVMVVGPNGVPSRVGANDTVELSSGNLKVGGDLTANGEVTLQTDEAINISAAQGVNISSEGVEAVQKIREEIKIKYPKP